MKTGEDVRKLGLYSSECCMEEMVFDARSTFTRCPHCWELCRWEMVEEVTPCAELLAS